MLRAEDRQGDGETQIAQGYDLIQAAGSPDIGLRHPQGDKEKQDAGAAHRNSCARDLNKCGKNGGVHMDAKASPDYVLHVKSRDGNKEKQPA
jgi:hypothetical protein